MLDYMQVCDQGDDTFSYLLVRWNYIKDNLVTQWLSNRRYNDELRYIVLLQAKQIVEIITYGL